MIRRTDENLIMQIRELEIKSGFTANESAGFATRSQNELSYFVWITL